MNKADADDRVGSFDAIYYFDRGNLYTKLGKYEEAIDDFSESIRLNPAYIKSLLMRGNAYLGAGEKDKAKADFDEYLKRKRELKNVTP